MSISILVNKWDAVRAGAGTCCKFVVESGKCVETIIVQGNSYEYEDTPSTPIIQVANARHLLPWLYKARVHFEVV